MKNFVCLVLTLFTFELQVTLFNYLEKFRDYLQVDNFQKVFFVYHYIKELEQNFYILKYVTVLLRAAVKCQLISKCVFGVFNSPKKRTRSIKVVFVRFFGDN